MGKAIILDTETTGLPPKGEACEIAWIPVTWVSTVNVSTLIYCTVEPKFHQTFIPIGDFHPQATATNGFTKENLAGSPCISTFVFPEDVEYMICHNADFDWKILKKPKVKLICTLELARKYLTKTTKKDKGNKLTELIERYYPEEAKELISNAHSALQDCKLCYLILLKVLEAAPELDSFEKLAEQCTQPFSKLPAGLAQDTYSKEYKFTFGKYKGLTFDRIDKDILHNYMTWIVEKSTMSQGLKDWVKKFLQENK